MPEVMKHYLAVQRYYRLHYEIQARMMGSKVSTTSTSSTSEPAAPETPRAGKDHQFQFKQLD